VSLGKARQPDKPRRGKSGLILLAAATGLL